MSWYPSEKHKPFTPHTPQARSSSQLDDAFSTPDKPHRGSCGSISPGLIPCLGTGYSIDHEGDIVILDAEESAESLFTPTEQDIRQMEEHIGQDIMVVMYEHLQKAMRKKREREEIGGDFSTSWNKLEQVKSVRRKLF
tara:strand:- start:1008 stop:1421 length:414 start_codon:yes stop_codon:yes gene_type:complete